MTSLYKNLLASEIRIELLPRKSQVNARVDSQNLISLIIINLLFDLRKLNKIHSSIFELHTATVFSSPVTNFRALLIRSIL